MSAVEVCLSSLFGIFQTALIVGVLSEALIIPPEEKRILALIEKQRLDKIRQNAAASLIQWSWRVYKYVYLGFVQNYAQERFVADGGVMTKRLWHRLGNV